MMEHGNRFEWLNRNLNRIMIALNDDDGDGPKASHQTDRQCMMDGVCMYGFGLLFGWCLKTIVNCVSVTVKSQSNENKV